MSMESFYGGRSGAPFIIVKRFDGIDIPQPDEYGNNVYTKTFYAVTPGTDNFIITSKENGGNVPVGKNVDGEIIPSTEHFLIAKTEENKKSTNYSWKLHENDGGAIPGPEGYCFLKKKAEGMVQCFKEGNKSSNEVNYGEYVIIDTIECMNERNNLDNGKIFRRGMDLQSELAGAEYVGQIMGPQGEIAELRLDNLDNVPDTRRYEGSYKPEQLIPGYIPGSEEAEEIYNDSIDYRIANVVDDFGIITKYVLGFKFPYLVLDIETESVSPYNEEGEILDTSSATLISDVEEHPYFEKWKFNIPKGVKGDSLENLRIIYYDVPKGAIYKYDKEMIESAILETKARLFRIFSEEEYSENKNNWYDIELWNEETQQYERQEGPYQYQVQLKSALASLVYTQRNFDKYEAGETVNDIFLGNYNVIDDIIVDDDGTLTIQYTYNKDDVFKKKIKWIDSISIAADGTFTVEYNNGDEYTTNLLWIKNIDLTQEGLLTITQNDGTSTTKTLKWIDKINIAKDGVIEYYYNNDHDTIAEIDEQKIQWVDNIILDGDDGLGSQKVKVQYNTEPDFKEIGDPINYILETVVTEQKDGYRVSPYHLLVLYSDPARRASIPEKEKVSYPSKYPQNKDQTPDKDGLYSRNDWHDLGSIRGDKGGFMSICEVPNGLDDLKDKNGTWIPPEYLLYARSQGADYEFNPDDPKDEQKAGWGTVKSAGEGASSSTEFFFYDYDSRTWFSAGKLIYDGSAPDEIISIGEESKEKLKDNGIWFEIEDRKLAN